MKEPTVPQKPCGLVIENRKKVVLTGVKEVDRFDETAVIQPESGEVVQLRQFGKEIEQPVVETADPEHQKILPTPRLDGADHPVPLLPAAHQFRNQLRRLLQVGTKHHRRITVRLKQRVVRRTDVTVVAGIEDHLDPPVLRGKAAQQFPAAVGGTIVSNDHVEFVLRQLLKGSLHPAAELFEVLHLVETAAYDCDFLLHLTSSTPSPRRRRFRNKRRNHPGY